MARPFLFLLGSHPRLLAVLLAVITLAALAGAGQVRLDNVPKNLFASDTEEFRVLARMERDFSTDEHDCLLIVQSPEGFFGPETARGFRRLLKTAAEVEGVGLVLSMASVAVFEGLRMRPLLPADDASPEERRRAFEAARSHPLVGGQMLSEDGKTALVIIRMTGTALPVETMKEVLDCLRPALKSAGEEAGFRTWLTGVPVVRVDIIDTMRRDQLIFMGAGSVISGIVVLLLFRSLAATFLVAAGPIVGLMWTFGILGIAGIHVDAVSSVLPTLVLVIGFTDAVHLGLDMRRQRAEGASRRDAVLHTVRRLTLPCGLTSLTTAVGFGSLCVTAIPTIRMLGLVTAIGTITTFFAVLTVVPFLATTFLGDRLVHKGMRLEAEGDPRWARIARPVIAWPRTFAICGILLTVALGWVGSHLRPDTMLTEALPQKYDSYEGILICDEAFGGVLEAGILIEWDKSADVSMPEVLRAIDAATKAAKGCEIIAKPLSILDVLAALPGNKPPVERSAMLTLVPKDAKKRFLREDVRRTLVRLRVPDRYASELRPDLERATADLKALEITRPGFRFHLTGPIVVVGQNIQDMIGELLKSLAIAAGVIFVILSISFRSVRLGLISLVPNVFPMVVTATTIVVLGWPLLIGNVIVFSICLGIAVDDTIHFVAAYRRARVAGLSPSASVTRSFVRIGTALAITTTVLVVGFATTLLSGLNIVWMFGALACVAIAAALPGDLFILPALLLWMDREHEKP